MLGPKEQIDAKKKAQALQEKRRASLSYIESSLTGGGGKGGKG